MNPATQGANTAKTMETMFTGAHHNVYEDLRKTLLDHVQAGVPGMDTVLQALNKAHVGGLQGRQKMGGNKIPLPRVTDQELQWTKNATPRNRGIIDPGTFQGGAMNEAMNAINEWMKSKGQNPTQIPTIQPAVNQDPSQQALIEGLAHLMSSGIMGSGNAGGNNFAR